MIECNKTSAEIRPIPLQNKAVSQVNPLFFFQPLRLVDEQEKNIEKSCFTPVHCFGLTLSVGDLLPPPVQRNVQSSGGFSSVVSFCVLFVLRIS